MLVESNEHIAKFAGNCFFDVSLYNIVSEDIDGFR